MIHTGSNDAVGAQLVAAQVREKGIRYTLDLLYGGRSNVPFHRDWKLGIHRIHDHPSTDLKAVIRKPLFQAGLMRPYLKIGRDLDATSGSGKENGTSLHQELINREHLFVVKARWGNDHQEVSVFWYPSTP